MQGIVGCVQLDMRLVKKKCEDGSDMSNKQVLQLNYQSCTNEVDRGH